MKKTILSLIALAISLFANAQSTSRQSFNDNWEFTLDNSVLPPSQGRRGGSPSPFHTTGR